MPRFNLSWFYLIVAIILGYLFLTSDDTLRGGAMSKNATYSQFREYVEQGYASRIIVNKDDGQLFMYVKP